MADPQSKSMYPDKSILKSRFINPVRKSSYPNPTRTLSRRGLGTESDPLKVGQVDQSNAQIMRIVHISDTHMKHNEYLLDIPHGDVIVHSGDFTNHYLAKGKTQSEAFLMDIRHINDFFSKLPHKHKIFVAGSHEKSFNPYSLFSSQIQQQLKAVIYLQDSGVNINGIKFYGSPWNRSSNMGFSAQDLDKHWRRIPLDTDVLITHIPPYDILDQTYNKVYFRKNLDHLARVNIKI